MALADSVKAIGGVSILLKSRLEVATSATTVDVGRPEQSAAGGKVQSSTCSSIRSMSTATSWITRSTRARPRRYG